MAGYDKVVVVTKKTALEELIEQFNTREQARFYLEHSGVSFAEYEASHAAYQTALARVKDALPAGDAGAVDRARLHPDVHLRRGRPGADGRPGRAGRQHGQVPGRPAPLRRQPRPGPMDGVLLPFRADEAGGPLRLALRGELGRRRITMARVTLNDGQTLHAVNDFFVGQRTHQSARYRLALAGRAENQSSSGIIVSTGAGSTGWLRSVLAGAAGIVGAFVPGEEVAADARPGYGFDWEADYLCYSVREPFESRVSSAGLVFGHIEAGQSLEVTSQMPQNGVIFSDGMEDDALEFNSGRIARIGLADKRVNLLVPG